MKKDQKLDLTSIEVLSETSQGHLIGGFSAALSNPGYAALADGVNVGSCPVTNNCSGGNCVAGCGKQPELPVE